MWNNVVIGRVSGYFAQLLSLVWEFCSDLLPCLGSPCHLHVWWANLIAREDVRWLLAGGTVIESMRTCFYQFGQILREKGTWLRPERTNCYWGCLFGPRSRQFGFLEPFWPWHLSDFAKTCLLGFRLDLGAGQTSTFKPSGWGGFLVVCWQPAFESRGRTGCLVTTPPAT